jgi:hypothetical protein
MPVGSQRVRPIYSISRSGRHGASCPLRLISATKALSKRVQSGRACPSRRQCRGACEHQGEEPPNRGRCGSTCRGVRSFRRLRGRLIGALLYLGLKLIKPLIGLLRADAGLLGDDGSGTLPRLRCLPFTASHRACSGLIEPGCSRLSNCSASWICSRGKCLRHPQLQECSSWSVEPACGVGMYRAATGAGVAESLALRDWQRPPPTALHGQLVKRRACPFCGL